MKKLNLKDAMQGLQVILTDDGYELRSAAGSACYDVWGVRTTVNGIPEYFPVSISVDNQRSKPENENGVFSIKAGQIIIKNANFKTSMVYSVDVSVNADSKEKEAASLAEMVRSVISDQIRKELLPGGKLYSR